MFNARIVDKRISVKGTVTNDSPETWDYQLGEPLLPICLKGQGEVEYIYLNLERELLL